LGPVINITIGGTLILNNGSLSIDSSDVINILTGGKIQTSGILGGTVSSGLTPVISSSGGEVDGPKTITNGTLPIKLIYFKNETVDDGIQLQWASAEERNFDYYELARSVDGKAFTSFATIPGKSEGGAEYTFVDMSPLATINFYKLTSVDFDGYREDMPVTRGEWSGRRETMTIYPNPVSDGTIHAQFFGGASGSLRLLDCNGIVIAENLVVNAFTSDLQVPPTVLPGVYLASAQIDGRTMQVKVIVR
jgi:hypothetical protein